MGRGPAAADPEPALRALQSEQIRPTERRETLPRSDQIANGPKIYVFKNIRFAAPPLGARRFAQPQPPLDETAAGVQTGAVGNMCVQIVPQYTYDLSKNATSSGGSTGAVGKFFGGLFAGVAPMLFHGDEDCLFLDLYVPGSAAREPAGKRLPVTSWYYGGAVSNAFRSLTLRC